MDQKEKIYRLTKKDQEVMAAAAADPNVFFDHFFLREGSDRAFNLDWNFTEDGKWQVDMCMAAQTFIVVVAGIGCSDVDSRIYDAELRRYVTFRWLIENKRCPVVLSRTSNGWKKVKASEPYFKGTGEMVRVTLSDGNICDVSLAHRFLTTNRGYVYTRDLRVGDALIAPRNLPSTSRNDSEDVLDCSQIEPSSHGDYLSHLHSRDGQSLPQSKSVQVFAPLQDDVRISNHYSSLSPDNLLAQECTCNSPRKPLSKDHPRKQHSSRLFVTHPEKGLPRRWREATCVQPRVYQQTQHQPHLQFENNSSQYWQDVLGEAHIDLGVTASYDVENGHIQWSYDDNVQLDQNLTDSIQDFELQHPVFQTRPLISEAPTSLGQTCDAYYSPCDSPRNYDTPIIIKIESLGVRDLYDIHVPIWNNYVMDGVVSHNTGKSLGVIMSAAYFSVMLPDFRFLNIAKDANQAKITYQLLIEQMDGTLFQKMVTSFPQRPYPQIVIEYMRGKEHVKAILSFFGLGDSGDATNVFSNRYDWMNVEEAGLIDNLSEVITNLSTRATGATAKGRTYMGRMSLISNAWPNPELWRMFDTAAFDNEEGLAINVDTRSNKSVTERQIKNSLALTPEEDYDRFMTGKRPENTGRYFMSDTIKLGESDIMHEILMKAYQDKDEAYKVKYHPHIGIFNYRIPRKQGRIYFEVGDPGTGQAPNRNAPCIMVWDVTDFASDDPNVQKYATLQAFYWGNGYGSIMPFVNQGLEWLDYYKPIFFGIDSTSTQKNMAEILNLQFIQQKGKSVEGITGLDFSAGKRYAMLIALRLSLEAGILQWPKSAIGISSQLGAYDPLLDRAAASKLAQDIVATMSMSAFAIRARFNLIEEEEDHTDDDSAVVLDFRRSSRRGSDRRGAKTR